MWPSRGGVCGRKSKQEVRTLTVCCVLQIAVLCARGRSAAGNIRICWNTAWASDIGSSCTSAKKRQAMHISHDMVMLGSVKTLEVFSMAKRDIAGSLSSLQGLWEQQHAYSTA